MLLSKPREKLSNMFGESLGFGFHKDDFSLKKYKVGKSCACGAAQKVFRNYEVKYYSNRCYRHTKRTKDNLYLGVKPPGKKNFCFNKACLWISCMVNGQNKQMCQTSKVIITL